MSSETTKVGIGQIVETRETSTGKILEVDWDMNKTIEVEILEEMQAHIRILEDRIVEESTGKDHFSETLITGEMIGVQVIVGLDQDWEQVPIETELGVINVGNMITSQRTVSHPKEIRTTSFNMHNVLHEKYYNIGKTEKLWVQTWSQTKASLN